MARNAFNPQGDTVVAKAFRFAGVEYDAGEPFPWRELGTNAGQACPLHENDLRGLWLADLVDFVDPEVARRARRARSPVKVVKKQKPAATVSQKPATPTTETTASPHMIPVEADDADDLDPPVVVQQTAAQVAAE